MNADLIATIGKYVIALAALVGCFFVITQNPADPSPAWGLLGIIIGWIVRDSSGQSATSNAIKVAQASQGGPTG